MKRKIIVLAAVSLIALLTVLLAVLLRPVETRVPVTGTLVFNDQPGLNACYWVSETGMLFVRGFETSGNVTINVQGMNPMLFASNSCFFGQVDLNNGDGVWYHKYVLTYLVEGVVKGTFEGILDEKTTGGYPINHSSMHCNLQGTGEFDGYNLILSGEKATNNSGTIKGFLLWNH